MGLTFTIRKRAMGEEFTIRNIHGVELHHKKDNEVRGGHEKKTNKVRVDHEKKRDSSK